MIIISQYTTVINPVRINSGYMITIIITLIIITITIIMKITTLFESDNILW